MKRKNNRIKNIVAILATFVFCIAGMSADWTVHAEEIPDMSAYMKQTTELMELIPEASNYSADASIEESTVPAFLLLITNGEESVVTSAFYMKDTDGSGNTYLVTSGIVGAFTDESYEIYLIRGDYSEQVTDIHMDSTNVFAFLTAEGIEQFEPMEMTADVSGARSALAWLAMDSNQNFYMEFEELDIDSWKSEGGAYTGDGQLSDTVLLGAPVIDLNSMNVWGMMYAAGDFEPVIIDLNYVNIPEEAAITNGTGDTNEQQPVTSEEENGEAKQEPTVSEEENNHEESNQTTENDMTKWLGIAAVVVVLAVVFKKKQPKKDTSAKQAVGTEEYREGTIPLYPQESEKKEYRQEFTPVVKAVAEPEAGKLYHANADRKIVFGRSNNAQVRFAENFTLISTKHCVLYRDDSGVYLMDLGSTNGTFFSETLRLKPNVPYRMERGSAFFLASPKYTFVITED